METRKCKGIGKGKGYGCGKTKKIAHYGLCQKCYSIFLSESPFGEEIIVRASKRAHKEEIKKEKQELRKKKEELKTLNEHKKELQALINFIVRHIDYEKGCISCNHGWEGKWTRQRQAGHYFPKHTNQSIRFNVFGIYSQCVVCNDHRSANIDRYRKGIVSHYGQDMMDYIDSLPDKYRGLTFTTEQLKKAIKVSREIKKSILEGRDYTRMEVDLLLDLYK